MKDGVVYPQIELVKYRRYDHIVIYDHVLGAVHADREPKLTGPYKENDPFHEPLVTYALSCRGVTKKSWDGQRV